MKAEKWIMVYMIDLDSSNIKELESNVEKMKMIFHPELVL